MAKNYSDITSDISAYTGELRKLAPEAMQGFYSLAKAASTPAPSTRRRRG
jgi:hypothetical protein